MSAPTKPKTSPEVQVPDVLDVDSLPQAASAGKGERSKPERPASRRVALRAGMLPFFLIHLSLIGIFWTGFSATALILCFALWAVRMFGVTGGYHRYFSHRSYKTSRVGQFLLAFLAQSSAQKGVLWWAAHHRHHHRDSDKETDLHSPLQHGFWYAHMGWLFDQNDETDMQSVRDLAKYPELRWLNKYHLVPPLVLGVATWLVFGWTGLFVGFLLSTVILWHTTFFINSLTHMFGKTRFETGEDSRNSFILALVTLGEGWHNNHHYYQACTRQGFYWWEVDISYYVLRGLAAIGVVWDLREPPQRILDEGRQRDGRA